MSSTRYRRGKEYAAEMAVYTRQIAADNSAEMSRLKRNLVRCIPERQRIALTMYYAQGLNMKEIGQRLGVERSTVSRIIQRGERRLQRCLRYGAETYLKGMED